MVAKTTITVANTADAAANNTNKKVIFKNYPPFTNYISQVIHIQIGPKTLMQ